jgi:tetratricopeptide (TPR) repeat protein
MIKKIITILTCSIILIYFSCNSGNSNDKSTKRSKTHGGIITFLSTKEFENQKSYDIYLKGVKCIKREDYECAKKYFEKALEIDSNNPTILCDLGITETRLFNYDRSSELLYKAIDIDSTYYLAHTNLGFNLYYIGKHNKAIEILNLVDVNNSSQVVRRATYFHLFMNYTSLKECDNAYKYYDLLRDFLDDKLFLENVERFKKNEFDKKCSQ